ncbi:hypothetical protein EC9_25110 [Rosistilla ulvae]|uniref:PEP-CTERM protein-sorting domain-containing protein n=2 Tax=Rosistilla ulvae TaxID=1930277 RepID=A0A517M0B4_9BACT|nr:hypothetical protein EC9_25110 [Rosistilla ulvae]
MTKYFALLALLLASTSANAASLFPSIVDPGGYDGVQDDLTFAGVKGTYVHGPATQPFLNSLAVHGDTLLGLYSLSTIGGDPLAPGSYAALIVSADFIGIGPGEVAGLLEATTRSGYSIGDVLPNAQLSPLFTNGDIAASSAALLTSTTLDFGSIDAANLDTLGEFVSTFDSTDYQVEGLFDLAAGVGGGVLTTLNAEFGFTKLATTFEPVTFLPATMPGSGLPGSYDLFVGSSGSLPGPPGTSLFTTAPALGGVGSLSGAAVGAVNPIPEPASMLTLLGCVGGACAMGRRRRKAARAA